VTRVKIMEQQWDYLIILDACRYDYLEQVWQNYFTGKLSKKISVGSSTLEWRGKSFRGYYGDVIYISANPYINSLATVRGFAAKEHFYKVYDVWRHYWDNDKNAVLPEAVTKAAIDAIRQNPDKRAIVHYVQPHEPYIGNNVPLFDFHRPQPIQERLVDKDKQYVRKISIKDRILRMFSDTCYRTGITGRLSLWRVRQFLKMPPMSHMDAVRRNLGKEGLRRAYKENLNIVLKHVAELVDAITGKIVITADHGEMLGENGLYSHWPRATNRLLLEIPWLEIDKTNSIPPKERKTVTRHDKKKPEKPPPSEKTEQAIQEEIRNKLRALGYYD
jgi:hypothetical protein